jgi:hypothetical protein
MSYYRTVLADFPISYYTLDEVKSGNVDLYSQLLANYPTYQAVKDSFSVYSDIAGQPVYDYSGNINHGTAGGISGSKIMPLVSGGIYGTLISDQTSLNYVTPGLANKHYADNPFSIEVWVKLPNTSSTAVSIISDASSNTGLYYQNGDLIFKVSSGAVRYKITNNKAIHVVASYNKNSLILYINGVRVATETLDSFVFTNESINFSTGPSLSNNYFVVDSVAFYRYNLTSSKILYHYLQGIEEVKYSQIVYPDGGYLFSLNHSKIRPVARYAYPGTRSLAELVDDNVVMPTDQSYITFLKTSTPGTKSFSFTETIIIPSSLDVTTSQIAWEDDVDNISISVSMDGSSWIACGNNKPIPFFNKNDGITSGLLYLKVTMTSSDTSIDLPIFRSLSLDFFSNTDFYADNSNDRIYSDKDYGLSRYNHPIISYNDYNGLRMLDGHGFNIDSLNSFRSIEMIFTPVHGKNVLFSSNSKNFSWDNSGEITKSGVSAIYVNGVDYTSSTNISSFFTDNVPHHVVLVLSSAATSNIKFNTSQDGTNYGGANVYSNIALYPTALTSTQILTHYQLYTRKYSIYVSDTAMTISEAGTGNDGTAYLINNSEYQSANI